MLHHQLIALKHSDEASDEAKMTDDDSSSSSSSAAATIELPAPVVVSADLDRCVLVCTRSSMLRVAAL